jgi:serine/threonine protein kinase
MIGKGKFSQVYMCRKKDNNEPVAMKQIDKMELTMREKEFLREEIQIIR